MAVWWHRNIGYALFRSIHRRTPTHCVTPELKKLIIVKIVATYPYEFLTRCTVVASADQALVPHTLGQLTRSVCTALEQVHPSTPRPASSAPQPSEVPAELRRCVATLRPSRPPSGCGDTPRCAKALFARQPLSPCMSCDTGHKGPYARCQ